VIGVSAGADVYAPTLGYLLAMVTGGLVVYVGTWIEEKMRVDDCVGAVAVHGFSGFLGVLWVGVFAAGYPTGINNVESSLWGQLIGMATFIPLGFLSGWLASKLLKKLNLLRVPPEIELDGLDAAEYRPDIHMPEHAHAEDLVIEPDGTRSPAEKVQADAFRDVIRA
jgi:ammonia channel protein AmtB